MSKDNLSNAVYILAAGESVRFGGVHKQLLDIGGETVLGRIIRQVTSRSLIPTVATHHNKLFLPIPGTIYVVPTSHDNTCDTMMNSLVDTCRFYTPKRYTILLGDVVYSKALMDTIIGCNDDIRVFGHTWEIFGISFVAKCFDRVYDALWKAVGIQPGKLRTFYFTYTGLPIGTKVLWNKIPEEKIFYWWNDWSNDMDSQEKYERFMAEIVATGTLDEQFRGKS